MSLQLRLVLILLLSTLIAFVVNGVATHALQDLQDARVEERDQSAAVADDVDRIQQGLITELQLRRRPGINLDVVQSHAHAREERIREVVRRLGGTELEALAQAVMDARESLDRLPRDDMSAAVFGLADAQDRFVVYVHERMQADIDASDFRLEAAVWTTRFAVLLALGLGLVLTVIAARRWVVLPLLQGQQLALALARGERDAPVPDGAPAEAGQLLAALGQLQRQLREAEADQARHAAMLEAARDEALAAAAARQRFLASVSHELRTPLHGVIGVLDLLETSVKGEDARLLQAARTSSRDLHELVEDILAYTSAAEDSPCEPVPVRGTAWLGELVAPGRTQADSKGLELAVVVGPEVPGEVLLDRERLGRAVTHLVDNAIKFTEQGGVVVRMERCEEGLVVRVVDTGPGIPDEVLAADVPFAVGDGGWTRAHRGVGFGLCLVRALVRRLDGRLDVRSSAEGTDIAVVLPAQEDEAGRLVVGRPAISPRPPRSRPPSDRRRDAGSGTR